MANTAEADVCNEALLEVGQRQPISSLDPLVDSSEFAEVCAVIYPATRDALLARAPWGFATREQVLATAALGATDPKVLPGYAHVYVDPADILLAQYIFDGIRPGAAALPVMDQRLLLGTTTVSPMPAIAGRAQEIPFKRSAGYVFTDWSDTPAAWSSTTTYSLHAIVVNADGTWSRSIQDGNTNHATTDGAWWTVVTDPSSAVLVYTAQITDATLFPPLFKEALRLALAVKLALSLPKPDLAQGLKEPAAEALELALAALFNGQAPEIRPDASFISIRGGG